MLKDGTAILEDDIADTGPLDEAIVKYSTLEHVGLMFNCDEEYFDHFLANQEFFPLSSEKEWFVPANLKEYNDL